jgi:hypothetical protein
MTHIKQLDVLLFSTPPEVKVDIRHSRLRLVHGCNLLLEMDDWSPQKDRGQ